MEELLKQKMQESQTKVSEMEEFVNALPEICDFFCRNNWKMDSQYIVSFLQDLIETVEEKGMKEVDFIRYPKMAQLIEAICNKQVEKF